MQKITDFFFSYVIFQNYKILALATSNNRLSELVSQSHLRVYETTRSEGLKLAEHLRQFLRIGISLPREKVEHCENCPKRGKQSRAYTRACGPLVRYDAGSAVRASETGKIKLQRRNPRAFVEVLNYTAGNG